jgi:hypothetical protein
MMNNKKGQAAMEFLMTYGWAILVVLAAIAALAYFGVLSPDRFLPNKCTLPSGMACLDFNVASSGAVQVAIQNSLGFEMTSATATLSTSAGNCTLSGGAVNLTNGEQTTLAFSGCAVGQSGSKFNAVLDISYTNADTGLTHTASGTLVAKVV